MVRKNTLCYQSHKWDGDVIISEKIKIITPVFFLGAFCYGTLEILWRGYTHPAMLLLGGVCLSVIYMSEHFWRMSYPIVVRSAAYAVVITALELVCGLVVNVVLGLNVWNYSKLPYNFMGQVCLGFSLLWFILALFCCLLCKVLRYAFK